jgi:hypothetical protein
MDVATANWDSLKKRRIFFGHQSVGKNILDGMRQLSEQHPEVQLNFVNLDKASELNSVALHEADEGWFADAYIGENGHPDAKLMEFASSIEKMPDLDIALAKFCYLDIGPQSNVQAIFQNYKQSMERLKILYPEVAFVHFTSPLSVLQTGPKAWVKQLIGRDISGYKDNIKRHEYNQLLRKEYLGKEPLFDIALLESTRQDGTRMSFTHEGQEYFALAPEYSPDDGHLNTIGQIYIASEFLKFLADLMDT